MSALTPVGSRRGCGRAMRRTPCGRGGHANAHRPVASRLTKRTRDLLGDLVSRFLAYAADGDETGDVGRGQTGEAAGGLGRWEHDEKSR